jgi:hypothetical protein
MNSTRTEGFQGPRWLEPFSGLMTDDKEATFELLALAWGLVMGWVIEPHIE